MLSSWNHVHNENIPFICYRLRYIHKMSKWNQHFLRSVLRKLIEMQKHLSEMWLFCHNVSATISFSFESILRKLVKLNQNRKIDSIDHRVSFNVTELPYLLTCDRSKCSIIRCIAFNLKTKSSSAWIAICMRFVARPMKTIRYQNSKPFNWIWPVIDNRWFKFRLYIPWNLLTHVVARVEKFENVYEVGTRDILLIIIDDW